MNRGIVIGKFSPLHIGHISLIKFAEQMVDELIVLVDNHESFSMDLETRISILKKTFPHLKIRGINESTFQEPSELNDFWGYWVNIIKKYVPEEINSVIGSMDYVKPLAEGLGAKYIIVDEERNGIPVSATKIKSNIDEFWDFLAPESKPYFLKNIALVGAESCGKSTLTAKLAKHFRTVYVPEYGRTFVEKNGQDFKTEDFGHIARAHMAHATSLKPYAKKNFFYDTEAIITQCWHEFFFNQTNEEVEKVISNQKIDLYLLVPVHDLWVEDEVRYHPQKEERIRFYNKVKEELIKRNQRFVEIKAQTWDDIFQECVDKIKELK